MKHLHLRTLFILIVLSIAGCSGSSESGANGSSSIDAVTDSDPADTTVDDDTSDAELQTGNEPLALSSTRVDFMITVPAYQSNALQVRVQWGELDINAAWNTDELWTLSSDFPTNTESRLTIDFNDRNGDITLARFETDFRTGSTPSETFLVAANQFDTTQFDDDSDGINNLDELLADTSPLGDSAPSAVQANLEVRQDKTFSISWNASATAQTYRVLEDPNGVSGFTLISDNIAPSFLSFNHRVALYNRVNARYIVQACNAGVCADSQEISVSGTLEEGVGYFKASDSTRHREFGASIGISADGSTLAVNDTFRNVYVYERANDRWQEETILQIPRDLQHSTVLSISGSGDRIAVQGAEAINMFERINGEWQLELIPSPFGFDVTDSGSQPFSGNIDLSLDGNTLAFTPSKGRGATTESSKVVYVFFRGEDAWLQQATLEGYGTLISLSGNGEKLVIGDSSTDVLAADIDGSQHDNSTVLVSAGSAYVFTRTNSTWLQEARLLASNADTADAFGSAVEISADGNTVVIGAASEDSASQGINGSQSDENNYAGNAGAVYVYTLSNSQWQQQAYLKASNTAEGMAFGRQISISADGNTLAVSSAQEDSSARGINGDQNAIDSNRTDGAGAVYLFARDNSSWQQRAYIKSSNTGPSSEECMFDVFRDGQIEFFGVSGDAFGSSVSLSADGETLAVAATLECSSASGINGDQTDNSAVNSGAVYLY